MDAVNEWVESKGYERPGTRARLVSGTTVIDGTLATGDTDNYAYWNIRIGSDVEASAIAKNASWTFFVAAPPKPELPTEAGWYVDEAPTVWRLSKFGNWHKAEKHAEAMAGWEMELLKTGTLTRLEPRTVTAKAFADEIMCLTSRGNTYQVHSSDLLEILAKFGVAP